MDASQAIQHEHKKNWYDRTYKLQILLPLAVLVFCVIYLGQFYVNNGDIIYKDVSITGGTTITVFKTVDIAALRQSLSPEFPDIEVRALSDFRTGEQRGFFVETSANVDLVKAALEKQLGLVLTQDNSSIEFTGSALSSSFYQQLRLAVIIAFVLMAVVVFIIFRTLVPSLAVILAAFADIVMTIVVVDIYNIQLSTAGIVALLMLIGYSVDTDILLTSRVLRGREGTVNQRIFGAFKTGIMMTLTAIAAVAVSYILTSSYSETLRQMFTILLIGLGFDIFNTWITNASLIKWYAEAKKL